MKNLSNQDLSEFIQDFKKAITAKSTDQKFNDYSLEEIHRVFMEYNEGEKPFEQILSICDSLFDLLDNQEALPEHLKVVLWHLFKSYSMYKALLQKEPNLN